MPVNHAWIADVVIAATVLEAIGFFIYRSVTGSGPDLRKVLLSLLPGLFLVFALRTALVGAPWPWVALSVLGAGVAHVIDVVSRFFEREI